jgi:hypothetical protein
MRKQFVYEVNTAKDIEEHQAHGMDAAFDRKGVAKLCPWASKIMPACGGWVAFESVEDARTWKNQK